MKKFHHHIFPVLALLLAVSCSTTRVLQENEYRLTKNRIEVTNDEEFNTNQLTPYLQQKADAWNPMLYVYNWTNGRGKAWDRLVQKIGVKPLVFEEAKVENTITNITNRLEQLGYFDSKVESNIKLRNRKATVTYYVTLGKRIPISDIILDLPPEGEFTRDFLLDSAMTVHAGDFLSEAALESETERSASLMRNLGYYDFSKNNYSFEADTLSSPGNAILHMSINEFTRTENPRDAEPIRKYRFNDVTISYPVTMKMRENVLTELNTIVPGELYSETTVNNTYTRLSALNIFSSVSIGMTPVDTNLVNVGIVLSQSKMQGFKVGFEASSNSSGLLGLSPQLSYYHKNIFRGGEWLNLSFMGNFQFKINDDVRSNEFGVSGGLSFPKFFPLPYRFFDGAIPRTEFNASYNYQNRPEYTRNMISTSLGYNGNIKNRFFYQVYPVQLNIVKLSEMQDKFYNSLANDPFLRNAYQNHFDFGSGGMLYYTTNTSSIPTSDYHYARLQLDIAGNLLSAFKPLMRKNENGESMLWNTPYSQFARAELTLGKTWFFGRNDGQSLATRFLVGSGYAYGNSSALPFEKHFYGGGANSLRGWQARTVGPGFAQRDTSFVIPNQTGDMKMEANIEYRFNMFWKLAGAAFVDVGNVWTLNDSTSGDDSRFRWRTFGESLAANWGLGVRLNFGFLLLRIDVGFKVHDPSRTHKWVGPKDWLRNDGYAFHFGVGYPF